MTENRTADDLLELIRVNASLAYLSDIHWPSNRAQVFSAIADIASDCYDAEAWQTAASYILGTDAAPSDAGSIRCHLLAALA